MTNESKRDPLEKHEAVYPNLRSRLLLGRLAEKQPLDRAALPPLALAVLALIEKRVLRVDTSVVPVDRPIFLLGMPRSGTTMLQDILCAHESVAYLSNTMNRCPSHCCGLESLRKAFKLDFETDRFIGDSVRIAATSPSDGGALWGSWFGLSRHDLDAGKFTSADMNDALREDMRETVRKVIWCYGQPWRRYFSKVISILQYAEYLPEVFPDAKFIHIVRDARNNANSMVKLCRIEMQRHAARGKDRSGNPRGRLFIPYPRFPNVSTYVKNYGLDDIRTTAHLWNDAVEYVERNRSIFPHFLEIRYEDLLADPCGEMARILEFCELSMPDSSHERFHKQLSGVGRITHRNQYMDYEVVEEICRPGLIRHGYLTAPP